MAICSLFGHNYRQGNTVYFFDYKDVYMQGMIEVLQVADVMYCSKCGKAKTRVIQTYYSHVTDIHKEAKKLQAQGIVESHSLLGKCGY